MVLRQKSMLPNYWSTSHCCGFVLRPLMTSDSSDMVKPHTYIVFSLPLLEGLSPDRVQSWAADLNLSPEKVSTDTGWVVALEHAGTREVFSLVTLLGVFPMADWRGWNARLRICRGGGILFSLAEKKKGIVPITKNTIINKISATVIRLLLVYWVV